MHCRGKLGRASQHTQAYRCTFYPASKHQIRQGWRAVRSSTSQGGAEPLCTRVKGGANREVSEEEAISGPWSVFLQGPTKRGERLGSLGRF